MMNDSTPEPDRFAFGANWRRFLGVLDEDRIRAAERSLTDWLGAEPMSRSSFLDVGCGSGLFSLAARRLGASVRSFDYDSDSVSCTALLRDRFFPDDPTWVVEQGSVLDHVYLERLPTFDIVYSWGVLHHTGSLWRALENVSSLVRPGGALWIAVYDDRGRSSVRWTKVKRLYNRAPPPARAAILALAFLRLWGPTLLRDAVSGNPRRTWTSHRARRGMDPWRDTVDWVGGYPFEVSTPERLFEFFRARGFVLERLRVHAGANNEMLFRGPFSPA